MADTILQLWDGLVGDQSGKSRKKKNYEMVERGSSGRMEKGKFLGWIAIHPEVDNVKFINTKQISNWEDFTKRSIAPDRKNPATELISTWAPTAKPYFGEGGS